MDPELAALASSAETALVAAWTTDAWTGAKQRLARLVARQLNERPRRVLGDRTPAEAMRDWSTALAYD
ncbi:hypothetical protein ABZ922_20670 [Streptomyces shenzhenensis]|uniref:hypothetical protein n=1 Tax=Streptomyces shenzhenensis TaxID=943815 RepID=UPI0033C195EC